MIIAFQSSLFCESS